MDISYCHFHQAIINIFLYNSKTYLFLIELALYTI